MIGISMVVADTDGAILIKPSVKSEFRLGPARVTRTANLDGTVTINHGGVSDGDRTFSVLSTLSESEADTMWYIFKNSTLVNISAPDGAYVGAIEFLNVEKGELNMTLLVKEKVSA